MASEVLIRFGTAALERAKAAAAATKRAFNEALKAVKDREARRELRDLYRRELRESRVQADARKRELAGLRELGGSLSPPPLLERADEIASQAHLVASLARGTPESLAFGAAGRALQFLGVGGFAASAVLEVARLVKEEVEREHERLMVELGKQLDARLERLRAERDVERRLLLDPDFAERVSANAIQAVNTELDRGRAVWGDGQWLRDGDLPGL